MAPRGPAAVHRKLRKTVANRSEPIGSNLTRLSDAGYDAL